MSAALSTLRGFVDWHFELHLAPVGVFGWKQRDREAEAWKTMTKLEDTWFDNCLATLGEAHDESVYGAIERLVLAGEQVGFTVQDLIRMLKAGMTLESLLDLIEVRMTCACIDSDSATVFS